MRVSSHLIKVAAATGVAGALLTTPPMYAQQAVTSQGATLRTISQPFSPVYRLLSPEEGRRLVDLAMSYRSRTRMDCSHFVHRVYQLDGLDYPYTPSSEIYRGLPNFRAVQHPQPGDLIVWHGHVGLVVDPADHSFFGETSTGLNTEYYTQRYWRRRGHPRFYRYMVSAARTEFANASMARIADRAEVAVSESTETDDERGNVSGVLVGPADQPLTGEGIVRAITRDNEDIDLDSALKSNIFVYQRLHVEKLQMKGDRGWAQIRADGHTLAPNRSMKLKHRSERARWELRQSPEGWRVFAPGERIYIARPNAVRLMAQELADTADDGDSQLKSQARLARVLDKLLNGR